MIHSESCVSQFQIGSNKNPLRSPNAPSPCSFELVLAEATPPAFRTAEPLMADAFEDRLIRPSDEGPASA